MRIGVAWRHFHERSGLPRNCSEFVRRLGRTEDVYLFANSVEVVDERLHFVPYTDSLEDFYNGRDIYVFPTSYESFGLTLLEAIGAGLPSIATEVGGMPELIEEGCESFPVPAGDVDALANRIRRLSERPDLRTSMGQRALESVKTQDAGRVAESYSSLFVECVGSARR